jgi:hypothetical protein
MAIEAEIRALYKKVGVGWAKDVPIIFVPSLPVGAFLAPMLAHADNHSAANIEQLTKEATAFAFGEVTPKLLDKHQRALSHTNTGGAGAYCSQPGGGVAVKMIAELRKVNGFGQTSPLQRLQFDTPANLLQVILRAGTETVRKRIHKLYKCRVRYHAYVTNNQCLELGACPVMWPNKRFTVVCHRPTRVLLNNNLLLHATDKAAVKFADGWAIYTVAGVPVPAVYVQHPETLTVNAINKTSNVEVKRALIQIMGYDTYLQKNNAKLIHKDMDQDQRERKLWQLLPPNEKHWAEREGLNLLEVFNSTPEVDGSYKKYFLQVPGAIVDCNAALNWMMDDINPLNLQMRIET